MEQYYFRHDHNLESPVAKVYELNGKLVSKETCYKCMHSGVAGWLPLKSIDKKLDALNCKQLHARWGV